jgi:two-component system, NtrC family, response regulator GlrR
MKGVTRTLTQGEKTRFFRRKLRFVVHRGPDAGAALTTAKEITSIGTSDDNDLVLKDATVSRYHLRVAIDRSGLAITDLGSTNGTRAHDLRIEKVIAEGPIELRLGETALRVEALDEEEEVELSSDEAFGEVIGKSPPMRELFRRLESASKRDVTVLIEGETGTGKELIAREIHQQSPRKKGPFVVVDCGAIPPTLIESELFGHVKGAYTGAESDRLGAFEEASGGTILLDEIGELDLAMQPRLLRVLESREIKRIGEAKPRPVDLRVVAATHRDLQRGVNEGTFRADLYYRLAVLRVFVPPLRDRREDIPFLFDRLLESVSARLGVRAPELDPKTRQQLVAHPWPGNVRELRNFVERLVALSGEVGLDLDLSFAKSPSSEIAVDDLLDLPFRDAKAKWSEHFDVRYLARLLDRAKGNVAEASRTSGIDRVHLFRLIKKYGLRR